MSTEVIVGGLWKVNFAFWAPDKNRYLSRIIFNFIVQKCPFSVFRSCLFVEFVCSFFSLSAGDLPFFFQSTIGTPTSIEVIIGGL